MAKVKITSSFTHESKHFAADEIHDEKDIPESCKDLVEVIEPDKNETVKRSDKETASQSSSKLKKL